MPITPPLTDTETPARLRAVIGRLARRLRGTAAAHEAGLTPTSASVLLSVVRAGPTRISELADSEGINPTMLSRVIAHLVDTELLQRVSDAGDRRAAWVRSTPAGTRLAERMRRERTDALSAALAGVEEADRRRLEEALPALEGLAERLKGTRP